MPTATPNLTSHTIACEHPRFAQNWRHNKAVRVLRLQRRFVVGGPILHSSNRAILISMFPEGVASIHAKGAAVIKQQE